jgi:hypothetical protein
MSKINFPTISINDFVQNHLSQNFIGILFWDTCSLLDIIRLPYRNGDINSLSSIIELKNMIDNGTILSVCSSLTITEWNEHEDKSIQETNKNLGLTSTFHKNSVDMINRVFSTTYSTTQLDDKGLVAELENIAVEILNKTFFLNTDTISDNALWRVAQKKAPASKKQEFKDCAIWETVLSLASIIQGNGVKVVYFTVNTDDYLDKSRNPNIPYSSINSEAVSHNISFSTTFVSAYNNII